MSLLAVIAMPYCSLAGSCNALAAASSSSHVAGGLSPFGLEEILAVHEQLHVGIDRDRVLRALEAPEETVVGMKSATSSVFIRSVSGSRNSDSGGTHGSSMNRTS